MKEQEKLITIRGHYEDKDVMAVMVGKRVAVHQGFHGDGFTISDPVTGRAFVWHPFWTKQQALRKARAFVQKFGTNPLRGFKLQGERVLRKPPRVAEMKRFLER